MYIYTEKKERMHIGMVHRTALWPPLSLSRACVCFSVSDGVEDIHLPSPELIFASPFPFPDPSSKLRFSLSPHTHTRSSLSLAFLCSDPEGKALCGLFHCRREAGFCTRSASFSVLFFLFLLLTSFFSAAHTGCSSLIYSARDTF